MNRRCTYVVAYDIRSPRRLARVAKVLSEIGFRLQYSVFAADLTEPARGQLIARLRKLIDPAEDDVRIYLVPEAPSGAWFGSVPGGDVMSVSGAPAATLATRLKENIRNTKRVQR
ncbi:CRISPR-associated endonuclease Cas2 [Blastochloris sulfoviridis]|uniref:CRISPR-associated endoribonuclease Cas2 n=1 Tax=Blastochloris sulfoviridis TaxID=50712 RepID=A0A5M6HR77_9HYPH|nr:CRISPR-associated endonuclease Cas2 [Blastochloris sulfoviridis]KAA5598208.1 CRISPR-associated endonuclease Cas2 [Blastochloris sulfoviridis]